MINYKTRKVSQDIIVSKTCDICKKTVRDCKEEWIEYGNFVRFSDRCGYGSIFGDGSLIEIDICQHCLNEKLGKFLRIN